MKMNRAECPIEGDSANMTFREHLEELRGRLGRSLLAIVISAFAAGLFVPGFMQLLRAPLKGTDEKIRHRRLESIVRDYERQIATETEATNRKLKNAASELQREQIRKDHLDRTEDIRAGFQAMKFRVRRSVLRAPSPLAGFKLLVMLAVISGIIIASPYWMLEAWVFLKPGLRHIERKMILLVFTAGMILFSVGVLFGYFFVVPTALDYLVQLAGSMGLVTDFDVNDYLQFVLMILLAFGIVFETPLVVAGLARAGIVSPGMLTKYWRYYVVGMFVLGAVLTPPDVFTQLIMASVLGMMYFVSIGLSVMLYPDSRSDRKETVPEPDTEG